MLRSLWVRRLEVEAFRLQVGSGFGGVWGGARMSDLKG